MESIKNFDIKLIREWAYHQHDIVCNQKYSKIHPYSFHLEMVDTNVLRFSYLLEGSIPMRLSDAMHLLAVPKIDLARAGVS